MSIVEVRGLCKAFGDNKVLKNLDFQIEKGETTNPGTQRKDEHGISAL